MTEKYPGLKDMKKKADGHGFMLQAVFYTVENNVHHNSNFYTKY